jgi:hypothetical protein
MAEVRISFFMKSSPHRFLGDLQPKAAGAACNKGILAGEIECLLDASHGQILELVGDVLLCVFAG